MQKWGPEAARPQIKKNGEKFRKLERGGWEKTSPISGSRLTSGQLLCFQKECNQILFFSANGIIDLDIECASHKYDQVLSFGCKVPIFVRSDATRTMRADTASSGYVLHARKAQGPTTPLVHSAYRQQTLALNYSRYDQNARFQYANSTHQPWVSPLRARGGPPRTL